MQKKIIPPWICGMLFCGLLCSCASLPSGGLSYPSLPEQYSGKAAYYYSLSVLARLDGNLDEAIRHLKEALADCPESPYLTAELVSLYIENNEMELALPLGEYALTQNPGDIELRSMMGGLYFKLQKFDRAVEEYKTIIKMDSENLAAYLYLATIYAHEKKYRLAENCYLELLKRDPDNIIGMYYYAKTLILMDRPAEAEIFYQKIIAERPAFDAAWLALAGLYEEQKKYQEAIDAYRRYLDINPARAGFRVKVGELLIKTDQPELAEKEFLELLKALPTSVEARMALGLLYYDLRRFAESAAQFAMLLRRTPKDDKLLYLLASALEQKGDLPDAREAYLKVSPAFDLYANAQVYAAVILKKEGRLDDAISVIERALQKKEEHALLYLYLSSLYEEKNDLEAAKITLSKGLELFPRNTDMLYLYGALLEKTNRFEESIQYMEKALEIDPDNADALNFIGYSYAERGIRLDEAQQLIVRALKMKPDNGYILDSLGWVYFRKNNHEEALKYIQKALSILPNDVNILEHLGDICAAMGRKAEALDAYRKAARFEPSSTELKKKIENLLRLNP